MLHVYINSSIMLKPSTTTTTTSSSFTYILSYLSFSPTTFMAISTPNSLLFLFFFFFLLFSLRTQARAVRESHFFNKATRDDANPFEPETLVDNKHQLPSPKQEDPTTTTFQQSQTGYGLYANRYNNQDPVSTTAPNVEYNTNDLPSKYSTEFTQGKSYENKEVYPTTTQLGEKSSYGMSDTRFLENGRYFYDINSEKDQNRYGSTRNNYVGYRSTKFNNNNMGSYYEPTKRVDPVSTYNNYGGGYYSNNENAYEFNNESMNRFRNGRQQTDEDFEP